ncbi:SDR family NAD(P)-dependent oxidoreductase [Cryptosporangium phraense]|uniref:3-oxoacyl-ACP reductase FabG n=1 Tax=Cryptosporangium phraense TaxID=2593070 RepID=A0A545AZY9_9ACTN|nr:3-oxoacyl-ACP reductase family protein [Cryptosporangium phraense]TQS46165.1 3-oxoacyl-ACP reductase FabG [Cryptosporangium phraense]
MPPDPNTTFGLDGRVIWITGASRGIGAAITHQLALAGAHLVLQARTEAALQDVCAKAEADGAEVIPVVGSITDEAVAATAVRKAEQRWGHLDGLVNNAGISPVLKRSETMQLDEWREVCETNLTGTFIATMAAGRQMLDQGAGSIVNVSSVHGQVAGPRIVAYAASKGGVDMLTRSLGVEWADRGVRVNAVAPGYVETDMTEALRAHDRWSAILLGKIPMARFATPQDVVGAVHFLLSDAARYLTGTVLNVDGGWTAQ